LPLVPKVELPEEVVAAAEVATRPGDRDVELVVAAAEVAARPGR